MRFYIGLHIPAHCDKFNDSFISINILKKRVSDIHPINWILDSGAFTQIVTSGDFIETPKEYATLINRWSRCGHMVAAVSQDYMCESFILNKWNRTVRQHQKMTVDRYYQILDENPSVHILPVVQGYTIDDYITCSDMYDFKPGTYVGIGSVYKRNKNIPEIREILSEIKKHTDFKLHGFGLKVTALSDKEIGSLLYSSDSMAWSFNARAEAGFKSPNRANDWTYAMEYYNRIRSYPWVE